MVKITTFNNRPVRHVRYMPDETVIVRLYEWRSDGRARHLRVSLQQWPVGLLAHRCRALAQDCRCVAREVRLSE